MRGQTRLLVLLGTFFVFGLDWLSKRYIVSHLRLEETIAVIPGVFQITRLQNTGVAFSLFNNHSLILTAVAACFFLVFLSYMLFKGPLDRHEVWGFSFVLGGALGNLADRLFQGSVTDFLDVIFIHYPVFNLADSFILMGIVLLFVQHVKAHQTAGS